MTMHQTLCRRAAVPATSPLTQMGHDTPGNLPHCDGAIFWRPKLFVKFEQAFGRALVTPGTETCPHKLRW
jgi:hypothetical protein